VLPNGPYIGLGLWRSVPLTVVVEVAMFAAGIAWYARGRHPRLSFWLLMGLLFVLYIANLVSPAPPSVAAIAWTSIVAWLFIPWAWWADRPRVATEAERTAPGTGARARQ
jgi:hypothetical protein